MLNSKTLQTFASGNQWVTDCSPTDSSPTPSSPTAGSPTNEILKNYWNLT